MSLAIRLVPEPLRSLAAGAIEAGFTAIGEPLANASRILLIQNFTDETVAFSFDGVSDHLILPTQGFILLDASANRVLSGQAYFAQGTTIYAAQVGVPMTGDVYVSTFYGTNGGNG
jgi:hypothetical protein